MYLTLRLFKLGHQHCIWLIHLLSFFKSVIVLPSSPRVWKVTFSFFFKIPKYHLLLDVSGPFILQTIPCSSWGPPYGVVDHAPLSPVFPGSQQSHLILARSHRGWRSALPLSCVLMVCSVKMLGLIGGSPCLPNELLLLSLFPLLYELVWQDMSVENIDDIEQMWERHDLVANTLI